MAEIRIKMQHMILVSNIFDDLHGQYCILVVGKHSDSYFSLYQAKFHLALCIPLIHKSAYQ